MASILTEMTVMSEKLTDDILMNCHYPDLVSASDRLKKYSDLVRETSSVWNFCSCSSDIISWGSQAHHEMFAVFSGYEQLS